MEKTKGGKWEIESDIDLKEGERARLSLRLRDGCSMT